MLYMDFFSGNLVSVRFVPNSLIFINSLIDVYGQYQYAEDKNVITLIQTF